MIDDHAKTKISLSDFDDIQKFISYFRERHYSQLLISANKPNRDLGYNSTKFLLLCLQRSWYLYREFIECINKKLKATSFLATRAHFETTGSVGYYLRNLYRFYEGELNFEEIDSILFKLSLGSRIYPKNYQYDEESEPPNWPEAINVLTQIDSIDKLFSEMASMPGQNFRDAYDLLSEFCHPNLFGLIIGSDIINETMTIVFKEEPDFKDEDYRLLINLSLMSCGLFFIAYDRCFSIIKENEELPILVK